MAKPMTITDKTYDRDELAVAADYLEAEFPDVAAALRRPEVITAYFAAILSKRCEDPDGFTVSFVLANGYRHGEAAIVLHGELLYVTSATGKIRATAHLSELQQLTIHE